MPYYCTVPRCTSMAGKAKNVSFHQFPRDEELAKLWNRILKRGKPYTKYSKVCSLHFKPEDYTITSVGKNKGQWRTLRKDAIPSQNLPSESPAPHTRRSTGCWVPSQPTIDPLVQQQMAQAIYVQTMLAMQAAGAPESIASNDRLLLTPEPTQPSPSGSSLSEIELLLRDRDTTPKEVTYKCQECTKCFKDPDVFILHKRTHKKDTLTNIEKENYSTNIQDREETLRANPILANLLKSTMRLEPENILTVENQIMTALASNMEAYIRTLTSMIASQGNSTVNDESKDDSEFDDESESNDLCRHKNDEANSECGERNDVCVDINENDAAMDEDGETIDDPSKRLKVTSEDKINSSICNNHELTDDLNDNDTTNTYDDQTDIFTDHNDKQSKDHNGETRLNEKDDIDENDINDLNNYENHSHASNGEINDEYKSTKNEVHNTIDINDYENENDRLDDAKKDELAYDDNGKLNDSPCDSIVEKENVALSC